MRLLVVEDDPHLRLLQDSGRVITVKTKG